MVRKLCLLAATVLVLEGAALLYSQDISRTAPLLIGVTLFTFGLMTISLLAKDWFEGKKRHRFANRRWHH